MNLIIDFDSTIISEESLEVLFDIAFSGNPSKGEILNKIARITEAGMNGEITFKESISQRINLLPLNKLIIDESIRFLKTKISKSFINSINNLQEHNIHIISGGFKEIIDPVLLPLGISSDRIHANNFVFDEGDFLGIDKGNLLAGNKGKVNTVKKLSLKGYTIAVGDGFSDYEIKIERLADKFVYYNEFIEREKIKNKADVVVNNFGELVDLINISEKKWIKYSLKN